MSVSVITPTRLLPDRLNMLVALNASLSSNNCEIEHVIVIDGKDTTNLPGDLAKKATIISTARPIGQAAAPAPPGMFGGLGPHQKRVFRSAPQPCWLNQTF